MPLVFVFLGAYLLGSIPFGLLLTKLAGLGDIRTIGSGNIGATNVLRTGNKKLAALTLLLDVLKGAAAIPLVEHLSFGADKGRELIDVDVSLMFLPVAASVAVVLGHMYPVWLRFRGGKGVATAAGVLTALSWPVGLAVILTWVAVACVSRLSSLAALVAACLAPAEAWAVGHYTHDDGAMFALVALMFVTPVIFWKHRANIQRLLNGTEPKIGRK